MLGHLAPPSTDEPDPHTPGGSSGIGLASTRLLATHGAHVLVGDVAPPPSPIAGATFQRADVREWAELVALFETAVARYGRVDVVVANAGASPFLF